MCLFSCETLRESDVYACFDRSTLVTGLLELENCLPEFVTQPRVRAPQPKYIPKEGYVKKQFRNERELNEIYTVSGQYFLHATI